MVRFVLLLHFMAGICQAQNNPSRKAQILAPLVPLPENAPRDIMNPYHAKAAWKIWQQDSAPMTFNSSVYKGTFKLPEKKNWKYPAFKGGKLVFLPLKAPYAGIWDDCYISLDHHHTRLRQPRGLFIDGGKMRMAQDTKSILAMGANFTSQSYSDRGRAIVDDVFNNLKLEKNFFFANCIRATPAHASYEDRGEEMPKDVYDGLFGHAYQSVGQSGSEMHAIYKMMLAGGAMPRETKNLLKKHGVYATALLTLFKAGLPYADAAGKELPYEHEMRHRVAYSSHGTPQHIHYCPADPVYHGYDDTEHIQNMLALAEKMTIAPPVCIARLRAMTIKNGANVLSDKAAIQQRIKCATLTNIRVWGKPGDILELKVDLSTSYDLQKQPLVFTAKAVYPNQKNIFIKEEKPGVFLVRVTHDPKLPKGRIPLIFTARNNGLIPSNPVFVNFYWPGEKEESDYFSTRGLPKRMMDKIKKRGLKHLPVNVNKRPLIDTGLIGDVIQAKPGESINIKLSAKDPEGYPIRIYRRSGELGQVKNGTFTATIPKNKPKDVYPCHFIFSDGTGGHTGRKLRILVGGQSTALPAGFNLGAYGNTVNTGKTNIKKIQITFSDLEINPKERDLKGAFVFSQPGDALDLSMRLKNPADSHISLLITNAAERHARRMRIQVNKGKISAAFKGGYGPREDYQLGSDEKRFPKASWLRLVYAKELTAVYCSVDKQKWQQLDAVSFKFFKQALAGFVYSGSVEGKPVSLFMEKNEQPLPMIVSRWRPDKKGRYRNGVMVDLRHPAKNARLYYTTDGSQPTAKSTIYKSGIKLGKTGEAVINAIAIYNGKTTPVVSAFFKVNAPPKPKPAKKPSVKKK